MDGDLNYNPADKITAYNIFGSIGYGAFNLEAEYMTGKVSGIQIMRLMI